jgi:hypothetical protein
MCTELLPPGGYPTAVYKYIISYHIVSYNLTCCFVQLYMIDVMSPAQLVHFIYKAQLRSDHVFRPSFTRPLSGRESHVVTSKLVNMH